MTSSPPASSRPEKGVEPAALTVLEVLRRSAAYLGRAQIPSPRFEAELLLASALGLARIDLYLQFDRPLQEPELVRIRSRMQERAQGRPAAYVIGMREFFGLDFKVGSGALIPRPETELLVELALAVIDGGVRRCADLGSGSGCIAVSLAVARAGVTVDAVDSSQQAIELTAENSRRHHAEMRVRTFRGSWAEPLRDRGVYGLIVSNPPYVTTAEYQHLEPVVRAHEPRAALDGGEDGLVCYRALLGSLPPVVAPGTAILLEGDPRRLDQVAGLCRDLWAGSEVRTHKDLSGRDRVLEVCIT